MSVVRATVSQPEAVHDRATLQADCCVLGEFVLLAL